MEKYFSCHEFEIEDIFNINGFEISVFVFPTFSDLEKFTSKILIPNQWSKFQCVFSILDCVELQVHENFFPSNDQHLYFIKIE